MHSDEIEYRVNGSETQFIEIALDPGESAIAEAGSLLFMDTGISMNTIFGDGSNQTSEKTSIMGHLIGAGKRLLTGESLFTTAFTNQDHGKKIVAFAAPYPGKIIPVDLRAENGSIICQRDAFLCAAKGVSIGIAFQKKIMTGLFGGEGFIMQKLEGDGMAFIHAGGTIFERELKQGETLKVDTGCLVAIQPSVSFDTEFIGGVKTAIFGGEGLFLAKVTGPGKVWLQSLPISHLAGQILNRAGDKGQSGAIGGLESIGNLFEKK